MTEIKQLYVPDWVGKTLEQVTKAVTERLDGKLARVISSQETKNGEFHFRIRAFGLMDIPLVLGASCGSLGLTTYTTISSTDETSTSSSIKLHNLDGLSKCPIGNGQGQPISMSLEKIDVSRLLGRKKKYGASRRTRR